MSDAPLPPAGERLWPPCDCGHSLVEHVRTVLIAVTIPLPVMVENQPCKPPESIWRMLDAALHHPEIFFEAAAAVDPSYVSLRSDIDQTAQMVADRLLPAMAHNASGWMYRHQAAVAAATLLHDCQTAEVADSGIAGPSAHNAELVLRALLDYSGVHPGDAADALSDVAPPWAPPGAHGERPGS